MKKVFLLASMMMVMTLSAQERPQQGEKSGNRKEQRERPTVDQQLKEFDQYNLSSAQKKKVKTLLESRDSDMKKEFANREKFIKKEITALMQSSQTKKAKVLVGKRS